MARFVNVLSLFLFVASALAQNPPVSDPSAVALATQSMAALTGGTIVSDVTLNANVISIFGSDNENGTGTFQAKGTGESRVDLSLSSGTRSDVRNLTSGSPGGAWEKNGSTSTAYAQHNCWTDAAWFFPALSSLTQIANPNFVFKYIGQEQHGGVTTQHVRVLQIVPQDTSGVFQRLSTIDFYLDMNSSLPLAVASQAHADNDMNTDIATEVHFANYNPVQGVQVPFHFQRLLNGGVVLDATVTNAAFNTGLSDSVFTLQ